MRDFKESTAQNSLIPRIVPDRWEKIGAFSHLSALKPRREEGGDGHHHRIETVPRV